MNKVSDVPEAVVSASETDSSPLTAAASKKYATPKRLNLLNTVTPGTDVITSKTDNGVPSKDQVVIPPKAIKQEPAATTPSINLGPRLTGGKTPARAMSLMPRKSPSDSSKENVEDVKSAVGGNAAKRNLGSAMKKGKAAAAIGSLPVSSQFLAAKISPLRSSARIKKRESPKPDKEHAAPAPSKSPLPDIAKEDLLSPCGMILTPRTPNRLAEAKGASSSAANAPLTPSNFANDFGKGSTAVEGMDANGVFAWLHSPTMLGASGLFSPNGGLAQSLTNTPRGMYGFSGKTPNTPSTAALAPPAAQSSSFFLEGEGVQDKNSKICISPLASQKKPPATPNPTDSVLNTPMSIDFTKVFATPRLPTPRFSKTGSAAKKDIQTPVLSTMERNIIDEDLNAMLQLAEKTPNGTRSIGFMSPLITNSLRQMGGSKTEDSAENLSDLQLPNFSSKSGGPRVSPQLAVRSSSAESKEAGGKKRKTEPQYPHHRHAYPQPPNSSMLHYRQGAPPHGYYPHPPPPGYAMTIPPPQHHYPPPPQHYAYGKATPQAKPDKTKRKAAKNAKEVIKKAVADDGSFTPSPPTKKPRKSPSKPRRPKSKNALPECPIERARVAEAIRAVNANSGGNNDKAAELAAAIMRGVTCRPSGKWVSTVFDCLRVILIVCSHTI